MLKLYYCIARGRDSDWVEVIVADSIEEAENKWLEMVEEDQTYYSGEQVYELELEGYEVTVKKNKN